MDLETENRIAAMLMKEAAELRRQAEKEGVHAYLKQPNARFRPNSRFLTATVLGVQQANRVVEVNEMWRARQKELELDDRCKDKFRNRSSNSSSRIDNYSETESKRTLVNVNNASASCSSSERVYESGSSREDEELEVFLHSRAKRGRGGVGPRMDETGPYLPPSSDSIEGRSTSPDGWRRHDVVYGPEKASSLKSHDSSEEKPNEEKRKKSKKFHSGSSSDKQHSRKHRSKDNSVDKGKKKKRKEERRNKHRK